MSGEAQPGAVASEVVANPTAGQAAPGTDATAAPNTETPQGEQPDKPSQPEKTFTQKELDAIVTREKAKAQRQTARIAAAEAEARVLREQAQARNGGGEREERRGGAASEDSEPDPKDFRDYDSWNREMVKFTVRQETKQAQQREAAERRQREAREDFEHDRTRLMKDAKEFDDFEDVVFSEEAPITKAMMRAALESDIPSKLAYYLALPENRDEAMKIAELTPTRQAARVHELAAKLATPPKPNANPPPIKASGGESKVSTNPDDLPMDQWLKWRRSQPDLNRKARRP
jgi:hypothetical protein